MFYLNKHEVSFHYSDYRIVLTVGDEPPVVVMHGDERMVEFDNEDEIKDFIEGLEQMIELLKVHN